jgi:hypothetical protein
MNKEVNGLSRRFILGIILFCILVFLSALIVDVFAYELEPYQDLDVKCHNCTVLGDMPYTHINETITFSCTGDVVYNCSDYNSTCKVTRDLEGGEVIVNKVPPCDINVTCDAAKCGEFQDISYPTYVTVKKDEGMVRINIEVVDFNGISISNWTTSFQENATVDQRDKYEYLCKHEVITETNMQTCSQYFEEYAEGQDILTYESILAMSDCFGKLVEMEGQYISVNNDLKDCEVDLATYEKENEDCHARLSEAQVEHKAEVQSMNLEHNNYVKATVPITWMWFAYFLLVALALLGLKMVLGGQEFGG